MWQLNGAKKEGDGVLIISSSFPHAHCSMCVYACTCAVITASVSNSTTTFSCGSTLELYSPLVAVDSCCDVCRRMCESKCVCVRMKNHRSICGPFQQMAFSAHSPLGYGSCQPLNTLAHTHRVRDRNGISALMHILRAGALCGIL